MAKEIERKYLVVNQKYKNVAVCVIDILQGYISRDPERTVRVRIKGDKAYITVKGITCGCERDEWEYEIDVDDARQMLERVAVKPILSKTRYIVRHGAYTWEVDEFHERLDGLVIAEVELPHADAEVGPLPDFVGEEVTGDERYYNSNLSSLQNKLIVDDIK